MAKRAGIPVYHMEAGNRCYDDRVPEEVNRRLIDHASDVLMPYTERSRDNLLREGIPAQRIFVTGNPIREVLSHYETDIQRSDILQKLDLGKGQYFLVTLHRAENVDIERRLVGLLAGLNAVQRIYRVPVIVSTHPRTRERIRVLPLDGANPEIRFLPPFGLFDFVALERNAMAVLTDSGTVQEECAIFGIPNVTLRDTTERPETLECGSNLISGGNPDSIVACVRVALDAGGSCRVPPEYSVENVSDVVLKVMLGYTHFWHKNTVDTAPILTRAAG
jgi:UDP-N-acetylglucosamine 2-epimerase (non-hydrolysing)